MDQNTETGGGTRFNQGKSVQTWAPWRGLDFVWSIGLDEGGPPHPVTPMQAIIDAEQGMRYVMHDPLAAAPRDGRLMLAHVAYLLLQVLQETASTEPYHLPALGTDEVCRVSEMGAMKYAPLDWEQGQKFSTLMSSSMRHAQKCLAFGPLAKDPESNLYHIGHWLWNILCLLDEFMQGRHVDLDDITPWQGVTTAMARKHTLVLGQSSPLEVLLARSIEQAEADRAAKGQPEDTQKATLVRDTKPDQPVKIKGTRVIPIFGPQGKGDN